MAEAANTATNVVLQEAPDIYLFGALMMAAMFLAHDEREDLWRGKFMTAIDELNNVREREELNASLRPARLPAVF